MRDKLFQQIKPYSEGFIKVSGLHTLHYEEVGNPDGKPVIFLHGGPGVGIVPQYRQFFDPKFYRIILLDQRGSGQSTPFAEIKENTTQHLVEDLEKLKIHLGIKKWLVTGGSWGSTLALCYAIKYPSSVKAMIIRGVCLGRKKELDWLMKEGGASEIWPDEWEKFISIIPKPQRKDLPKAYFNLLNSKNKKIKIKAAKHWAGWEGTIMSMVPDKAELEKLFDIRKDISFSKIESYYTINDFFMPSKNYILDNAHKMKSIPLTIVQGRYDTICPADSAYQLHKKLPKSKLIIARLGSHTPLDPDMVSHLIKAGEDFKKLWK